MISPLRRISAIGLHADAGRSKLLQLIETTVPCASILRSTPRASSSEQSVTFLRCSLADDSSRDIDAVFETREGNFIQQCNRRYARQYILEYSTRRCILATRRQSQSRADSKLPASDSQIDGHCDLHFFGLRYKTSLFGSWVCQ